MEVGGTGGGGVCWTWAAWSRARFLDVLHGLHSLNPTTTWSHLLLPASMSHACYCLVPSATAWSHLLLPASIESCLPLPGLACTVCFHMPATAWSHLLVPGPTCYCLLSIESCLPLPGLTCTVCFH